MEEFLKILAEIDNVKIAVGDTRIAEAYYESKLEGAK